MPKNIKIDFNKYIKKEETQRFITSVFLQVFFDLLLDTGNLVILNIRLRCGFEIKDSDESGSLLGVYY
ncbi:hypothetical protein OKW24_005254 [Peribacillus simplex]|nr:hypothetical protein [Peribacillus simplex]